MRITSISIPFAVQVCEKLPTEKCNRCFFNVVIRLIYLFVSCVTLKQIAWTWYTVKIVTCKRTLIQLFCYPTSITYWHKWIGVCNSSLSSYTVVDLTREMVWLHFWTMDQIRRTAFPMLDRSGFVSLVYIYLCNFSFFIHPFVLRISTSSFRDSRGSNLSLKLLSLEVIFRHYCLFLYELALIWPQRLLLYMHTSVLSHVSVMKQVKVSYELMIFFFIILWRRVHSFLLLLLVLGCCCPPSPVVCLGFSVTDTSKVMQSPVPLPEL